MYCLQYAQGVQGDEEFRSRYWRLLPSNGDIPSPPIGQEDFADETQRTRASHAPTLPTARSGPVTTWTSLVG